MKYPEAGILPVIHLRSNQQAVEMAGMAQKLGAQGVFLIDHKPSTSHNPDVLLEALRVMKEAVPNLWSGINCLSAYPEEALGIAVTNEIDGVWVDNATSPLKRASVAERIAELRRKAAAVYFGGLTMKGPGYIEDPQAAAQFINDHLSDVDVAVTSGPGTGMACPPERLQAIRLASLDAKLGVASGVDVSNVTRHSKLVDYILVASSVETYSLSGVFVEDKLKELIEKDTEARLEAV